MNPHPPCEATLLLAWEVKQFMDARSSEIPKLESEAPNRKWHKDSEEISEDNSLPVTVSHK